MAGRTSALKSPDGDAMINDAGKHEVKNRAALRASQAAERGSTHESAGRADRRTRRRRDLRPRGRRARPDGRGRRADPRHVGRRPGRDRDRPARPHPLRGGGLFRRQCAADAVRAARRRAPRLPRRGARRRAAAVRPSPGWLGRVVNAMGEPIDGKGPLPPGPSPYPLPQRAAARACPPARRRAARSRRAGAQHLHDLLPRPAHGHLRRLRRRQVGAAVDAGAQRRRPTCR